MQANAGGHVLVPEGMRALHWDSGAEASIRGMALVVTLTLGLVGAFSALSFTSSAYVGEPSTRQSYVVRAELVRAPAPSERVIADPAAVDHTRTPAPTG